VQRESCLRYRASGKPINQELTRAPIPGSRLDEPKDIQAHSVTRRNPQRQTARIEITFLCSMPDRIRKIRSKRCEVLRSTRLTFLY